MSIIRTDCLIVGISSAGGAAFCARLLEALRPVSAELTLAHEPMRKTPRRRGNLGTGEPANTKSLWVFVIEIWC